MVICVFGESCTGKSTIADKLSQKINAKIYTGKDYVRLAKNETEAKRHFIDLLKSNETTAEIIIYVVSEKEHLLLIPEKSIRVLITAELDIIKERFTKRMNGKLPIPVSTMLEKRHGSFDDEKHDLRVESTEDGLTGICEKIIALCRN